MLRMFLPDFMDRKFLDDDSYQLYILSNPRGIREYPRNPDTGLVDENTFRFVSSICYVGISTKGIWKRWFTARSPHMQKIGFGQWLGRSYVGEQVVARLPGSLAWEISLFTLPEAIQAAEGLQGRNTNLQSCEAALIRSLRPLYNIAFNRS